jgi:2-polyprenyl-3-methyl-5-hydroxy-6-metoxy-1,4-benzoquinol methylase
MATPGALSRFQKVVDANCPSWLGGVAAPVRRKSEASIDGADGVVVQLNHHPVRENWKLRVFFLMSRTPLLARRGNWSFLCILLLLTLLAQPTSAQLAKRTTDEWIATLDAPARVQGLKVGEVLPRLGLKPGQIVADVGAGTGIFSIQFSRAVKPGGKVYAVEVDEKLIEHILASATEQGIVNIEGVFGEYDDPSLPETVDLAFINDVLHHIEHREIYVKNLVKYLKPTGRIAIIDFKPGQGGHSSDASLQVSQEQATTWMAAAGWKPVEVISDVYSDRWFTIYARQ